MTANPIACYWRSMLELRTHLQNAESIMPVLQARPDAASYLTSPL